MGETAEELRGQLARKRDDLGRDLEAIGDRVSPGRVVERKRAAVRQSFGRARNAVMGSADHATHTVTSHTTSAASSVHDAASAVAGAVSDAPDLAREHTQGNPMAAGLIALGVGLLVSTLMPASRREQTLAQQIQPALETAASEAGAAAQQAVEGLKPKAHEAVQDLKDSAQESVETVKTEAKDATHNAAPS
jgi:gas vesicle protein